MLFQEKTHNSRKKLKTQGKKLRKKLIAQGKKTENTRKKLREKLKTQGKNSKTQGKNSRFRQIHLVELPKTGPISKPGVITKPNEGVITTDIFVVLIYKFNQIKY